MLVLGKEAALGRIHRKRNIHQISLTDGFQKNNEAISAATGAVITNASQDAFRSAGNTPHGRKMPPPDRRVIAEGGAALDPHSWLN